MSDMVSMLVAYRELGVPQSVLRLWCSENLIESTIVNVGITGRKEREFTRAQLAAARQSEVYGAELKKRHDEACKQMVRYQKLILNRLATAKPIADAYRRQELAFKHKDHPVLNGGLTVER